jgi:uncharacterized metal-binding protein
MATADTLLAQRNAFRAEPLAIETNPGTRWGMLGYLWVAYGIVRFTAAALLIVYSATATLMFGALLSRVPDAFTLMTVFHILYVCAIALAIVAGFFSVVAGWSLISGTRQARMLATIAALLSVSDIPFGTTLGAYTLAVLAPRI